MIIKIFYAKGFEEIHSTWMLLCLLLSISNIVIPQCYAASTAEGSKFGFGHDYGSDLTFDGVPFSQLQYELDFPNEAFNPEIELLDAPVNGTLRYEITNYSLNVRRRMLKGKNRWDHLWSTQPNIGP